MTTQQLFLGIDCGTQGTKAIILDAISGQVLGQGAAAHTMISGANGRREQDTQQWLEAFTLATRRALLAANVDGQSILGIGVSGQQHGLVLLDDQGQVLRPAKLWCDTETSAENDRLLTHLGGEKGSLERLGVVIAPGYTVSKLLWTKEQHPAVFSRIARILLPHDYLNFWLTGRSLQRIRRRLGHRLFQRAHPSVGLATAARHRRQRTPASRAAGADRRPPSRSARSCRRIAEHLGINPDALVSSGGGDNMMGAIGTGNIQPGAITMSLGSSGTVYAYADAPKVSPDASVATFCSSSGGWLPLICTMNLTNATGAIRELFELDLEQFNHLVAQAPIGADGVSMLPFLNGERVPALPHATGSLHGLDAGQPDPGQSVSRRRRRHHLRFALRAGFAAPQWFTKPQHLPDRRRFEKRGVAADRRRHHEHPGHLHRTKRSRRPWRGDSSGVVQILVERPRRHASPTCASAA